MIRSEFGGEVTTYAYDPHGNLRYATPPESQPGGRNAGRVRVMHYDAFDRLERVVEPNGLQTQYRYDPNGNLVGVTDPSNRRTEYRYDRLNRRTHHVVLGPDDAVETDDLVTQWELDANGNARRITDPLGQAVEYEYDELDRRELGTFPVPTPLERIALREVRWVYDANGNVDRVEADKVSPTDTWTETTVQSWDALDRLEATTTRGVAIALEYDAAGNRTLVSTAEGSTAYAYDARHRLDYAVVDSERVEYTSLTDGRMDSVLYPNGTRTTYGYHPQTNRLTSLNHERNDGGSGTSFARAEVDWDRNGNRLEDRITIGGVTETTDYAYDVLDRMVQHRRQSSTGGTPETVTYAYSGYERQVERTIPSLNPEDDPNRTRTYTYEPSYGWLTQVDDVSSDGTTTITYGYDRNGNTSWRRNSRNSEEMRFTYDVFDQLQHVERGVVGGGPGESLGRYDYDVDGRRIRVRGGDRGDVDYYYDGLSVLQEMRPGPTPSDDPTELLAHYRYADRLLSLDRYQAGGNARQWYHHDTLGSVMALSAGVAESEAAGTMLASDRYDPYGAIREQTGDSVNRAGFTGHQQDRETGLIYMNARYYDPAVGRFLTADSYLGESGNPPSLQRYLYGFGNPGRWVDPTGHNGVEKQPQAPLQELRKDLQRVENGIDGVIAAYDGMRPYLPSHMIRFNQQIAAGLGAVREVVRIVDGLLGLMQVGYDVALAGAPVVPTTGYQRHQQAAQQRTQERMHDLYALGEAGEAYLEGRGARDVAADGFALYMLGKAKVQRFGHSLIVEGSADAAATTGGVGVQAALFAVPSGSVGRAAAGGRRAFSALRSGLQTLTGRAGAAERVVAARAAIGAGVAQAERATVEASNGLSAMSQAAAESRSVVSRVSQTPRAFEAPINPTISASIAAPVRAVGGVSSQQARWARWASDVDAIHAQVRRLGLRALRQAKGDWRRSEEIFLRYLQAANKRLEAVGSSLRFEPDAAAVPGEGRVWPWIQEVLESGALKQREPWPGSRRVEAALVDTARPVLGAPEVADSVFHQVLRVYDITLNVRKPSVVKKYSQAFDIPEAHVSDIRLGEP